MKELICLFVGNDLYTKTLSDGSTTLPDTSDINQTLLDKLEQIEVCQNEEHHVVAAFCSATQACEAVGTTCQLTNLRPHYLTMASQLFAAACRARQLVHFVQHSQFCPACGTPTVFLADNARRCPECSYEIYPQIAPACIVLVRRGDEILMVHAKNFRTNHYGLVAGFLEVGEALEECVKRELLEETGLKVDNIRYFGSQAWPFPSGLMVGFTADYVSGEIKIQEEELVDAQFFASEKLPTLPDKMSIARKMIDDWLCTVSH